MWVKKKFFILGTDKFGRDLLSRLIIGSRVSISIGFVAVIISLILGVFFLDQLLDFFLIHIIVKKIPEKDHYLLV